MRFEEAQEIKYQYDLIENFRSKSTVVPMLHNVDVFSLDESEQSVYINYMHIRNRAIVLIDAIAAKKQPALERFLFGLGIRHVGAQTAIDLANKFESIEKIMAATIDELREVDGVGEIVAESIVAWFADEDNVTLLEKFADLGVTPQNTNKAGG